MAKFTTSPALLCSAGGSSPAQQRNPVKLLKQKQRRDFLMLGSLCLRDDDLNSRRFRSEASLHKPEGDDRKMMIMFQAFQCRYILQFITEHISDIMLIYRTNLLANTICFVP